MGEAWDFLATRRRPDGLMLYTTGRTLLSDSSQPIAYAQRTGSKNEFCKEKRYICGSLLGPTSVSVVEHSSSHPHCYVR